MPVAEKTEQKEIINWRPHPGRQEVFHQNNAYECLYGGTKGPGKTQGILLESLRQINNPNYRAIIFRRTFPRLGEIIDRSFKYFPGAGLKFSDKDIQVKLPAWTAPSGAKIAFGHIQHEQDKYNYQGKEFHVQLFDEVQEFTETQYLYLMAQNRSSDKSIECYIRATANPGGVGHGWVKRRFIDPLFDKSDPYRVVIKFFRRVNNDDVEVERNDPRGRSRSFVYATLNDNPSLDQSYISTLNQLPELEQRAFLHGDWDVFKGQFFPAWRNQLHVVEKPIREYQKKFISLDYGFSAPSAVYWWQTDELGRLWAYRELYKEGLTYDALAREIMDKTPRDERIDYVVADPAIFGDRSHHNRAESGESGAETMQRVFGGGFSTVIRADNERILGWGKMRHRLSDIQDGIPALTFSARCPAAIRTIPSCVFDELKQEDLDTEGEDHAADSVRYAVMSRPSRTEEPEAQVTRKSYDWWLQMMNARLPKSDPYVTKWD